MLCEDGGEGEDFGDTQKKPMMVDNKSSHASNSVFISEVKRDRDYEVQKAEELQDFAELFSVRDLLGVGAFGVVLLVKNRMTDEKSALKIINKDRLSEKA